MKRTKLIASLMMCVFCLSFLVVGVWAAVTSVNFNLNGNLQFYPEGVYIELSGQVYRGDSTSTLEALSDSRFALEKQTNFDNSSGEPSGNFPIERWNIQNLTFTPVDRYIQVQVNIKNHSEFTITATPNVLLNNLDITSNTFTNFTVSDNSNEIVSISSGETKTYKLTIQLNDNATEFSANSLSISFIFGEGISGVINYLEWVEDDLNTTDVVDGYWTLTMGEYQGTPLVWRMVLKETESSDGTTDVESVEGYTNDKTLLYGNSYYFLLDTFILDKLKCSYDNEFATSDASPPQRPYPYHMLSLAEYFNSNIRDYLMGVDVYRGYTYTPPTYPSPAYRYSPSFNNTGTTLQTSKENFLTVFNILNSEIYQYVESRTLSELYSNIAENLNKESVTTPSVSDPNSEEKFWLLSYYEASKIPAEQNVSDEDGARRWKENYFLRTANAGLSNALIVEPSGNITYTTVAYTNCARPAFKISF